MRVVVTGATGYLGSHLAKALVKAGHKVIILKRSSSDTYRIRDLLSNVSVYDIDNCPLEEPFLREGKVDTVLHTATCYGRKGESLGDISTANTQFPLELLEKALSHKVGTFINTDTPLERFVNTYALSKAHFREWGKFVSDEGDIRFINVKVEHFYGPGDDDTKFPTYVIKNCLNNVEELKLTSGEQKRDFIYIDDVVSAFIALLEGINSNNRYYNYEVGSGNAVSIREFVETVHRLTGSKTRLNFGAVPFRGKEVMFSSADVAPLKKLGWESRFDLEEGLKITIGEETKN